MTNDAHKKNIKIDQLMLIGQSPFSFSHLDKVSLSAESVLLSLDEFMFCKNVTEQPND